MTKTHTLKLTDAEMRVLRVALVHSQEWIYSRGDLDAQDRRNMKTLDRIRAKARGEA